MFFFLLALFLVAFSLGIGLLLLTLLTYEKLRNKAFRDAALFIVAATILLLVDAFKTFGRDSAGAIDRSVALLLLILTLVGNGMMAFSIPRLAYRVVDAPVSRTRWAFHIVLIIAAVVLGYLEEMAGRPVFFTVDLAALFLLYIYGALVILWYFNHVTDVVLRSLLRSLLILIAIACVLMGVQLTLSRRAVIPPPWRDAPYIQLVYQISIVCLMLYFAVRYMYRPAPVLGYSLPAGFVGKFGISNRECEIISFVIQGLSHKQISEKLFISSRTVKNHIYNIYQKTGVENKVQLLNLIRSIES